MTKSLMTLDEIRDGLKDKKLHVVAKNLNLSYPTLKSLADGKHGNYRYDTLSKLTDYLKPSEK